MFWQSIGAGLRLFVHGEVWLGALLYAAAVSAFVAWIQTTVQQTEEGPKLRAGCVARALCGPLLQGFLVSALLVALDPLLLRGQPAQFDALITKAGAVVLAGIAAGGITALLALLPVLRGLMRHSYAATLFVQGAVAFRILVGVNAITRTDGSPLLRLPGPVETLGYFVVALVLGAALGMTAVLIRMQSGPYPVKTPEGQFQADVLHKEWPMVLVLMPFLQVLAGWSALLAYTQWVRLAQGAPL